MPSHKTFPSPLDQYEATLDYYWSEGMRQEASQYGELEIAAAENMLSRQPTLMDFPFFAIIQRPHRLFLPGDLVLYSIHHGCADRYPVWSVSSKGYKVAAYYMLFYRWHGGKSSKSGLIKAIWRPGDLTPAEDRSCFVPLDHPAAQSYLADLAVRETLPHR
jgi:hypothetical protein